MTFQIQIIDGMIGNNPVFLSAYDGAPIQYETGALAAIAVASNQKLESLSTMSTKRFRIVRIESTDDSETEQWKAREIDRLESGYYESVPWNGESWFTQSPHYTTHYCHMSRDRSAMVAFTESDSKGRDDKQKRIRPGRYLTEFFGTPDSNGNCVLNSDSIRYWAGKVSIACGESDSVSFARTPDDIERVYIEGPESCMSHAPDDYSGPCHPTRVYGAGDLAVAYLERESSIAARCISWPEKKIFGRVYGDGGIWAAQLKELLSNMGYHHSCDASEWHGARLLRIETDSDGFVAPYLDIPGSLSDDGEYLIIDLRGEHNADNESGTTENTNDRNCDECHERYNDESEGGYIESHDQHLCDSCYCDLSFYCEDCDRSCHVEDSQYIEGIDRHVCESCANDYPSCDDCGERHGQDSMYPITIQDKIVCESCYDSYDTCDECDDSDSSENFVEAINGNRICESCAESMVECVDCNKHDESSNSFVDSDGDSHCGDCRQSCLEFEEKESTI